MFVSAFRYGVNLLRSLFAASLPLRGIGKETCARSLVFTRLWEAEVPEVRLWICVCATLDNKRKAIIYGSTPFLGRITSNSVEHRMGCPRSGTTTARGILGFMRDSRTSRS